MSLPWESIKRLSALFDRRPPIESRAAVCAAGEPRRVARLTLASIIHYINGSLPWTAVDLFVVASVNGSVVALQETEDLFAWLQHRSAFCDHNRTRRVRPACHMRQLADPTAAQRAATLEQFKASFANWHRSHLPSAATQSPFLRGMGKFGLLPWLLQLRATATCMHMIRQAEQARRAPYVAVVRTRLDTLWFGPLPLPLPLPRRFAFLPASNDFGGVNDRFVVADRASFAAYASLYADLRHGAGYWRDHSPAFAEGALREHLDSARVPYEHRPMPLCMASLQTHAVGRRIRGLLPSSCARCKYGPEGSDALPRHLHAQVSETCESQAIGVHDPGLAPCRRSGVREQTAAHGILDVFRADAAFLGGESRPGLWTVSTRPGRFWAARRVAPGTNLLLGAFC